MQTCHSAGFLIALAECQSPSNVQLETLAIINQTEVNASFKVGDRVKMVIGEK
jgi:hypothetical protein